MRVQTDHLPARIIRTSPSPIRERPRERVMERIDMDSRSPRSSRDTLLVEPSPRHRSHSRSRHRSPSRHYRDAETTDIVLARPRSVSFNSNHHRHSSPMRIVDRHDDLVQSDDLRTGPLAIVVRPRSRSRSRDTRGYDLIRDTEIRDSLGDREEIHEVRRERRGRLSLVRKKR